jgi:MFS family permease
MAQSRTVVPPAGDVRMNSACGKWILLATVMGSGVVALDATVVNVALPSIAEEFNTGVSGLQWILSSYLLTLASLILLGGALLTPGSLALIQASFHPDERGHGRSAPGLAWVE